MPPEVDQRSAAPPPASEPAAQRETTAAALPVGFGALVLGWMCIFAFLIVTTDFSNSFSSDDGAYVLGAHALLDGDSAMDRPLPVVAGEHETIVNGAFTLSGPIPYVRHPAYLDLIRRSMGAFGVTWGAHLPGLLALLLFPFAVRSAARELDPAIGDVAFVLAIVSPLLVNGLGVWAHAPSALLGALSLRWALRLGRDDVAGARFVETLALSASLALGILIRAEALLWAIALLGAIVLIGRSARVLVSVSAAAVLPVAVFLFERAVTAERNANAISITLPDAPTRPSWLMGRPGAAWHELFSTASSPTLAGLVTLAAVVLAGYGAMLWRRQDRDPTPFLFAASALYGLRLLLAATELATGLLAAWPIAAVVIVAGGRRFANRERLVGLAGVLFVGAVLATQHSGASGLGWGGRYLTLLVPVLALLGARSVVDLRRQEVRWGSGPWIAVALLAVLPVASGLRATATSRDIHASSIAFMTQDDPDVVVTEFVAFGRLGWHATAADGVDWYRADAESLDEILDQLGSAGVEHIAVQGMGQASIELPGYAVTAVADGLRSVERNAAPNES